MCFTKQKLAGLKTVGLWATFEGSFFYVLGSIFNFFLNILASALKSFIKRRLKNTIFFFYLWILNSHPPNLSYTALNYLHSGGALKTLADFLLCHFPLHFSLFKEHSMTSLNVSSSMVLKLLSGVET